MHRSWNHSLSTEAKETQGARIAPHGVGPYIVPNGAPSEFGPFIVPNG
jgi:hypothetical protein